MWTTEHEHPMTLSTGKVKCTLFGALHHDRLTSRRKACHSKVTGATDFL